MPIYEYVCRKCGRRCELIRSYEDRDSFATCSECGVGIERVPSTVNINNSSPQMGAVLSTGEVIPGHFGKEAKRERKT